MIRKGYLTIMLNNMLHICLYDESRICQLDVGGAADGKT